jgi:hypothetical protein
MRRIPTAVKIAVPVVLLLVLGGAAVLKLMLEELPEYARAEALEARFPAAIETLHELLDEIPVDACDMDHESPEHVVGQVALMAPWWDRVEEIRDRFADPAILGAEVTFHCENALISRPIKDFLEPSGSVSRSMFGQPDEWPAVSLWYAGEDRLIRYEYRDAANPARGFRLTFDLDGIAEGG